MSGHKAGSVDLAAHTAGVNGLLSVTMAGSLHNATATGCKVRMKGDDQRNIFNAFARDMVLSGGGGRDKLSHVGKHLRRGPAHCGRFRSVFRGHARPGPPLGRSATTCSSAGRDATSPSGSDGVDTCRAEVAHELRAVSLRR